MTIGKRIREERLRCSLSQEEVAKALNTTKQAIYKYESDIVTNIPMDKVEKLSILFGVTPSFLMGWDEEENSPEEPKLTEGEKMLIDLFRQIPEDAQKMYLEVLRAALKNQS